MMILVLPFWLPASVISQNMSHLTYTNHFLNEVYPVKMKFDGSVMLLDGIVFKNGWHESKITAK